MNYSLLDLYDTNIAYNNLGAFFSNKQKLNRDSVVSMSPISSPAGPYANIVGSVSPYYSGASNSPVSASPQVSDQQALRLVRASANVSVSPQSPVSYSSSPGLYANIKVGSYSSSPQISGMSLSPSSQQSSVASVSVSPQASIQSVSPQLSNGSPYIQNYVNDQYQMSDNRPAPPAGNKNWAQDNNRPVPPNNRPAPPAGNKNWAQDNNRPVPPNNRPAPPAGNKNWAQVNQPSPSKNPHAAPIKA